ncbi:MAG: hypothetical protein C0518_00320 [Opitutus sp.]|nr:hypothetical protein [Opitutus sp.]
MPKLPSRSARLWREAGVLGLVTWLVLMAVFGRWSWSDWSAPHWLEGDPLEVYARVKVAAEQPWHALTSFSRPLRLGAPFGADWSGYVIPDRLIFVLTGLLSRATGLMAAVQLVSAMGFVFNAVSFFVCARWLGRRWEWAAAFALGYAFCNYNLRWGITLSLSQTFTLPPLVLLCAMSARSAVSVRPSRWLALALLLGVWLGLGNPYLAFFGGVVACGGLVLALLRQPRNVRRLGPLLLFIGVLTITFASANAMYAWQHRQDPTSVLERDHSDFARYALRPIDWFVPPADHRVPTLAKIGRGYQASHADGGEFFYNYLGLLCAAGLAGLVWMSLRRLRRFPWHASALAGVLWIVIFGAPGGLNARLGSAGIDVFRAGTRIGIFAAIWASFFLVGQASRWTLRWPRWRSVALAAGVAMFLIWEQTPNLAARASRDANRTRAESYGILASTLETILPAQGPIFQLPAVPFLEAGRTVTMGDYEHVQPLLVSESLRFSYGHLRTARAHRWIQRVTALPPTEMIAALQNAGYAAVWIDRRGFVDEAISLVAALRALRLEEIPAPSELPISVFRLSPAARIELPDLGDPRLDESWDEPGSSGEIQLFATRGWYGIESAPERQWRWAANRAVLGIWNDGSAAIGRLSFATSGRTGSRLHLALNGTDVWQDALREGPARAEQITLTLRPGYNELVWTLAGTTFRPGDHDPRTLGFMIENLSLSVP